MAWAARADIPAIPTLVTTLGVLIFLIGVGNYFYRLNDISEFNRLQDTYRSSLGTGGTSLSIGPGAYLAVVAGVVSTIGGLIGLARRHG